MAYLENEIEKLFNSICKEIEKGRPLRKILKDEEMPAPETFYKWIDGDSEKTKQYARSCEVRSDIIFEEIIEISDNSGNDKIVLEGGMEVVNHEAIQRDRLRVDARKWAVSKMNPKKYGDRLELDGKVSINPFLDLMKSATNDNG